MASSKLATEPIIKHQEEIRNSLPFEDTRDFEEARRGFVGRREPNIVTDADGGVVWNNDVYKFLKEESPTTANPSLWRQSRLSALHGLFKVVKGIYQVRGLDLSNTTFVEGDKGVTIIDPLTSAETGAAALSLYREHRGSRPVKAIIYTHSHADHFGGVKGFISKEEVDSGAVPVLAPEGFLKHAVAENVYAGTAMSRRAAYMYGAALDRGPQGQIGAGLGQTVSTGTITLIAPTDEITKTGEERIVDGVRMEFQMAPDTEAPSEMLIYFPEAKVLCAAEDATHTFHNLLTLRGALVRDPRGWAGYLTEAIDMFGGKAEVVFASHHWPTWGADRVVEFLTCQRDLYAYVHDQTVRMLNMGLNGPEIAEQMTLPPAIEKAWNARGYYGSVSHNVKAIYQRYMGWFDGNPAHLWQHVPVERAKRYVELIGGVDQIVIKARKAFDEGDLRWAAEILNHAVFAEPDHSGARGLLADTYEQLGYGAENGTWRNFYISGATELRQNHNFGTPTKAASADVIAQLTPEMLFDSLAIQINGPKAWHEQCSIDVVLNDQPNRYRLWLSNGALIYTRAVPSISANVTLTTTTRTLPVIAVSKLNPEALVKAGVEITGDSTALERLAALLDPGDPSFNIVTP